MELTIAIVYGSVRTERRGIKVARFLEQQLMERGIKVHFIDPLEHPLPLLDKMYREFGPGKAPEAMQKISDLLTDSDGFLVVTGEYNHSIPPALKNLLDHFYSEYRHKPSAIASYSKGTFGGVRAAVHLRVIMGELGSPSIPTILPFPTIDSVFDEALVPKNERVVSSTIRFLDELVWFAEALKNQRAKGTLI